MTSPMNLNHEHEESYGSGGSGISHAPSDGNEYVSKNAAWAIASAGGGGGGLFDSLVLLQDVKSNGTGGGTGTADAWTKRDLNTKVADPDGICILSSNEFTLDAGTYLLHATAPFYRIASTKLRLYNITDSSTIQIGQVAYARSGDYGHVTPAVVAYFTIAASKSLALQYYMDLTATDGLGVPFTGETSEDNVFAQVLILKLS